MITFEFGDYGGASFEFTVATPKAWYRRLMLRLAQWLLIHGVDR